MTPAQCAVIGALLVFASIWFGPYGPRKPTPKTHIYWCLEMTGLGLPCIYNSRTRNV
jgi:hypothetical protein